MLTQKNNGLRCISRDKNAVFNFKKIFNFYLETKGRPQRFCRGYDIDNSTPILTTSTEDIGQVEKQSF